MKLVRELAGQKKSLNKKAKRPDKDSYLFVLKENNRIVGISAIYTSVSKNGTSVFFKQKRKIFPQKFLNLRKA